MTRACGGRAGGPNRALRPRIGRFRSPRFGPRPGRRHVAGRQGRVARLASRFGFTGTVEYRHAYSQSGGAQFCFGAGSASDLLLVYAEAFERDSDPDDFSLAAIIAHECGHQRLLRDSNLAVIGRKLSGQVFEEVLASLIGSLFVDESRDAEHLVGKATVDLATIGLSAASVVRTIEQLRGILKELVR